jgi:hypothetical protein
MEVGEIMVRFENLKTSAALLALVLLCAAAFLPSACNAPAKEPAPSALQSAPASPAPAAPAPPTQQTSRKAIFRDDFKNPASGWLVFSNDFGDGRYEGGSYILRSTQSSYPYYKAYTFNPALASLSSFMLDLDFTMLGGSRDDQFGILLKWPDINPLDIPGYEQPSDYYFFVAPADPSARAQTKQQVKGSSVDKVMPPGDFLLQKSYACIKGISSVNNIKIWFNPNVRFAINDTVLVEDAADETLDYVNRLLKDKAMPGGELRIFANSEKAFSEPSFQLNRISVYEND